MRRAFTLIELLVVIAIIAILAAILFPVFAQAKASAKKITSLSNVKQLGTAIHMYLADSDDVYPIYVVPVDSSYGYSWGSWWAVPSSWATTTDPLLRSIHDNFVLNTLQKYVKNQGLYEEPNGSRVNVSSGAYGVGVPPASVTTATNYTYNGLLNGFPASGVNKAANLTVFWNGSGKANFRGIGNANPEMYCNDITTPCVYQPKVSTCSSAINGQWSVTWGISQNTGWDVHQRGLNYVYCDSHAKWRRNGVFSTGNTDPRTDPHAEYNGQFTVGQWYDEFYCHSYLFRPDFDFENWDPATRS